jgi:hypothetical protein
MTTLHLIESRPAEVFHPPVFIKEELAARGWTLDMLTFRMGPESGKNRLVFDLYLELGSTKSNMRIGESGGMSDAVHCRWSLG